MSLSIQPSRTDTDHRSLAGAAPRSRKTLLNLVKKRKTFPVVIVGGGINGIGVFRDLALQGVDCLIVDKGDFCSGASGASSRVIHGGLKYLETGEFGLVRESTIERNRLMKNAPHVVRPLEIALLYHSRFGGTIAAIKRFFGRPAPLGGRGVMIAELGLYIFDVLGWRERATPIHSYLTRKRLRKLLPAIEDSAIAGAIYHDSTITQPERLGLELILDAMDVNHGSIGLNYVSVVSASNVQLLLRDEFGGVDFVVEPGVVVNTTGAWIDDTNRAMNVNSHYIRGTKGSHIILHHPTLHRQLASRMVSFEASDGRECFAYPLLDKVLLGSTDLFIEAADTARCEQDEIDYLVHALRMAFPSMTFSASDIVFSYSGVRPLPNVVTNDPSLVSRNHSIRVEEPIPQRPYPIFSLVGGKWTTFRAAAEKVADQVLKRLNRARTTGTKEISIGGGRDFSSNGVILQRLILDLAKQHDISMLRSKTLLDRYGSKAFVVASFCNQKADHLIPGDSDYTKREISYIARNDLVTRLVDVIVRRTTLAIRGRLSSETIAVVAEVVGKELGWNRSRVKLEIDHATSTLNDHHALVN